MVVVVSYTKHVWYSEHGTYIPLIQDYPKVSNECNPHSSHPLHKNQPRWRRIQEGMTILRRVMITWHLEDITPVKFRCPMLAFQFFEYLIHLWNYPACNYIITKPGIWPTWGSMRWLKAKRPRTNMHELWGKEGQIGLGSFEHKPKESSNREPPGAELHSIYTRIHVGCVRLSVGLCTVHTYAMTSWWS